MATDPRQAPKPATRQVPKQAPRQQATHNNVSLDLSGLGESIAQQVYDAVIEEISSTVGMAVRDGLVTLESKLMNTIRQEVEHRVKSVTTSYEVKVMQLREDYLKSLEHVVKNIPVPVVNIGPTSVDVTVPESAIQLKVEQELKAKPKKTRTEKSVIYGATGRPEKIVEEVTESVEEENTGTETGSELTDLAQQADEDTGREGE